MKRKSQIIDLHTFIIIQEAEGSTRLTGVARHAWQFESSHTVLCHAWLLYKVTNLIKSFFCNAVDII